MKILSYDNTAEYLPEGSSSANCWPLLPMASPGNGGLIYGDKTILTREVTLKSMNSTATLLLDQPNRFVFA